MKSQDETIQGTKKEFIDLFAKLCYSRTSWSVWAALMDMYACSIANSCDMNKERVARREKDYQRDLEAIGNDKETAAKLFTVITMALENNPKQDFLGSLYMELGLGSHWKGQFFTPYHLCECMAEMTMDDQIQRHYEKGDFVSLNDPSCGAGATLIAGLNEAKKKGVNYQRWIFVTGWDIDRVTAEMCFVQLSLLGAAGYVAVTDSLSNPVRGELMQPDELEGQDFFYTPMYWDDNWQMRMFIRNMNRLKRGRKYELNEGTIEREKNNTAENSGPSENQSTSSEIQD